MVKQIKKKEKNAASASVNVSTLTHTHTTDSILSITDMSSDEM